MGRGGNFPLLPSPSPSMLILFGQRPSLIYPVSLIYPHLPSLIYNFIIRYINNSLPIRKNMATWELQYHKVLIAPFALILNHSFILLLADRFTWRHNSILHFIAKSLQPVNYCAFQKHANYEIQKPTDDYVFRCRQSSQRTSQKTKLYFNGFKRSCMGFAIGGFRSVLGVSVFQGSLLVIVIMIDGSEKRNCEGGF